MTFLEAKKQSIRRWGRAGAIRREVGNRAGAGRMVTCKVGVSAAGVFSCVASGDTWAQAFRIADMRWTPPPDPVPEGPRESPRLSPTQLDYLNSLLEERDGPRIGMRGPR